MLKQFPSKYRYLLVKVCVMGLVFCGCASSGSDSLELESVMEVKEGKQRQAQFKEKKLQEIREKLESSEADPEGQASVLALLELPSHLQSVSADELSQKQREDSRKYPPFAQAMWRSAEEGIVVLAGTAPMNADHVTSRPYAEFRKDLEAVAAVYAGYYQREHESKTVVQIDRMEKLITMKVVSKYHIGNDWFTDTRYFFLYDPRFRLNVFITGSDEALSRWQGPIDDSITEFQSYVSELFPEGIGFKA